MIKGIGFAAKNFGDIASALADYTDNVLFGDVWERPDLSPRDRSLVTITSLIALYRLTTNCRFSGVALSELVMR